MTSYSNEFLQEKASYFMKLSAEVHIEAIGDGNIHRTWSVQSGKSAIILQKFNLEVFPEFESVINNITLVTEHAKKHQTLIIKDEWITPCLLKNLKTNDYFQREKNDLWRAFEKVPNTRTFNHIKHPDQAFQVGKALGTFHRLIEDFPVEKLQDTLPDFHNTPHYYKVFQKQLNKRKQKLPAEWDFFEEIIQQDPELPNQLQHELELGRYGFRPIHGDPKVNNILFSIHSDQAISMIDLDTVKPGVILHDLGDCLRSACNTEGEESRDFMAVKFDLTFAEAILKGFFQTGIRIPEEEVKSFTLAVKTLTLELALRFATDYLRGNTYFNVDYPEQNLIRACNQAALLQSFLHIEPLFNHLLLQFYKKA